MKTKNTPRFAIRVPHSFFGCLAFAAFSALIAHCSFFSSRAAAQERTDNRRLVWTGSFGSEWDGPSWKTGDSYLGRLNTDEAQWTGPITGLAESSLPFLAGDSVIFDGIGDVVAARTVNIGDGGATVSDVVVSGAGNHTFTGGAITADGGALAPTTYQLVGSGVAPGGRLIKVGAGTLTLSNTAANEFKGGIWLAQGGITITNTIALGNNNISLLPATTTGAGYVLPAVVTDAAGTLLRAGTAMLGAVSLNVAAEAAGLEITGDIYLNVGTLTLNIGGDTLIAGCIYGDQTIPAGASTGAITKTGTGTLTLTGGRNWFYGTSSVNAGKLVATTAGALGGGNVTIAPGATLAFQGVRGATYPMAFTGGGRVEVMDSDITFDWRNGTLVDATTSNNIGQLVITATSRLTALASGTLSGVLGGTAVAVTVSDHSSLVVGREGISHYSINGSLPPINYAIRAGSIALTDASALVFQPNAFLHVTDALTLDAGSVVSFAGAGVSRLRYGAGTADPATFNYLLPDGMSFEIRPYGGVGVEYVVVNQGANPLKDIAMTLVSIDAAMDIVSAHLHEDFLLPVVESAGSRKWNHAAWARYFASDFSFDASSAFQPGWDGRLGGMLAGFDSTFRRRFQVGLYAGITESNLATTNNSNLKSKQRVLGLHAAQRFGWFYASLHLARVSAHSDSFRNEPLGLTRGRWSNSGYTGGGELGAILVPWKNGCIKPSVGLRYTKIDLSSFTEGGISPMAVDNFTDSLAQVVVGVQAGQRFKLLGRNALASLSLSGKHTAREPGETLTASYLGIPDTPITFQRDDYYKDTAAIGLSLRVLLPRRIQAGLDLEHESGSRRTRDTLALSLGIAW